MDEDVEDTLRTMLVFLDESYEPDEQGGLRHAYAGFGIEERQYRSLVAAVHQCKLRYFVQDTGLTDEERQEIRKTHFVTREPPEETEIKATNILTVGQARHHETYGNAPGVLMATAIFEALRSSGGVVFGILSYPSSLDELQRPADLLPLQFDRLLERVELWMKEEHDAGSAIIVPDTTHAGNDLNLSQRMAEYFFRSAKGKRMRHIVVNPFWVDSRTTAGSQVADLIAHILMNFMRPAPKQKPLSDLLQMVLGLEFHSQDLRTRGVRKMKRKQQA